MTKISRKLHEIKEHWTRGAVRPLRPPPPAKSATDEITSNDQSTHSATGKHTGTDLGSQQRLHIIPTSLVISIRSMQ